MATVSFLHILRTTPWNWRIRYSHFVLIRIAILWRIFAQSRSSWTNFYVVYIWFVESLAVHMILIRLSRKISCTHPEWGARLREKIFSARVIKFLFDNKRIVSKAGNGFENSQSLTYFQRTTARVRDFSINFPLADYSSPLLRSFFVCESAVGVANWIVCEPQRIHDSTSSAAHTNESTKHTAA